MMYKQLPASDHYMLCSDRGGSHQFLSTADAKYGGERFHALIRLLNATMPKEE